MLSSIFKAIAPAVGSFVKKYGKYALPVVANNAGKIVGSVVNTMKNSNKEWIKKAGNHAENAINSNISNTEGALQHQLTKASEAAQGKNVATDYNVMSYSQPQQQLQNALAVIQPQPFYNKNLGGTNFLRYRKRFKRVDLSKRHKRPFGNKIP